MPKVPQIGERWVVALGHPPKTTEHIVEVVGGIKEFHSVFPTIRCLLNGEAQDISVMCFIGKVEEGN